jgi:hypothetical protein
MTLVHTIIVANVCGAVISSALIIGLEEAICAWRVRNYLRERKYVGLDLAAREEIAASKVDPKTSNPAT